MRAFSNELAPQCWASLSPWQTFSDSSSAYSKTSNDSPPAGVLGARVEARVADDEASDAKGQAVATGFCGDPTVLAVVGHVNSNVSTSASNVYAGCGLAMLTPMSSNPAVTDRGLPNVFRLTNRDDHKGPGLAAYLYRKLGKRRAVVIDDQTAYGKGLADLFAGTFARLGGTVVARRVVKVGDRDFQALLAGLPPEFDVLFFGGIAEAAYVLKQMRDKGLNQLFACGDGCWNVKGFIQPAEGAATRGEVIGARRSLRYQGIAYARPIEWDAKGDNMAAVIFLNIVDGDRFKEIGEIMRDGLPN